MTPEEKIEKLFKDFLDTMSAVNAFWSDTGSSYIYYKSRIEKMIEWGKSEGDETDKEGVKLFDEKLVNLPKFSKLIDSMAIVYAVSKFEVYLNNCLLILIESNPNILKSSKQMAYKEILEFRDLAELREKIKEREILEFSYSSFKDKVKILEKKFSINLNDGGLNYEVIIEILTTRNIYLHNDGIINEVYLVSNLNTTFKIGDKRELTMEYIIHVIAELMRAGEIFYKKILEK